MRIVYITEIDINAQGAAMNRARLFVTGLRELGVECVNYVLSPFSRFCRFGFTGKCIDRIIRQYRVFPVLKKLKKGDIVVIYGQNPVICCGKELKRRGVIIVAERTEYPFDLIREIPSSTLKYQADVYRRNLHYADYFITVSSALENYYHDYTSAKMIRLPLILDFDYFSKFSVANRYNNYTIAYCGDMGNNKDGLPILLDAFILAAKQNSKLKLLLMGDSSSSGVMEQLINKVAQNLLTDRVEFTGKIPHPEVLHRLATSALCVLARPANLQAKGGIPSKMGEYLGLGIPSLFTMVGDIPQILTDNETGFLCMAGSSSEFAQKIIEIFDDYGNALVVANNGRQFIKQFDYKNVAEQLRLKLIK